MYSDMSRRIIESSSSKSDSARALASSVLPTPVGPRNMNEAMGLDGSDKPARERWTASATASTASSWPVTREARVEERSSSFWLSARRSFSNGTPVHLETTAATSASPTMVFIIGPPSSQTPSPSGSTSHSSLCWAASSSASSSALRVGRIEYLSSAARLSSKACSACSISRRVSSIRSLSFVSASSLPFSAIHFSVSAVCCLTSSSRSACSASSRTLARESRAASALSEISSICTCMSLRETSSSACGRDVASIFILAAASSMRSMALSGRKRSVM
mmetsp:Transcript_24731/g.53334  ORF Transcript_24731/g.53334 Transcript_24731/m.53334 type:complete len:277 (-) Transcript_24731:105-935(-)